MADESTGLLLDVKDGVCNDGNINRPASTPNASETQQLKQQSRVCFGFTLLVVGALIGSSITVLSMYLVGHILVVPVITPSSMSSSTSSSSSSSSSSIPPRKKKRQKRKTRRYTATQFISFSINTMGGVAEFGECPDQTLVDANNGWCYLGNSRNLTEDVEHRYRILRSVFQSLIDDALTESPKIDHSPNVLKIFMLPEFYWRGPNGAYSITDLDEDGALIQLGIVFNDELDTPQLENWLFVLGTAIIAQSPNDPTKPWELTSEDIDAGDILYYNVAPVLRGGPNSTNNRYIVHKNYIATADFLNREKGLPHPRESHVSKYSRLMDVQNRQLLDFWTKRVGLHFVQGNVFEIDGIRIGLEICLDHKLHVLWDQLQDERAAKRIMPNPDGDVDVDVEDDLVDVHLVVSAGMSLKRGPTPIKRGGVAYLTDGKASSTACHRPLEDEAYDPETVCRASRNDGPEGLKHITNNYTDGGKRSYSPYIQLSSCINSDDAPWEPLLQGYFSNHARQGCSFTLKTHGIDVYDEISFYPPSIEIYPTVDLP